MKFQTVLDLMRRTDWSRWQAFVVSSGTADEDWPDNPVRDISGQQAGKYDVERVSRLSAEVIELDSAVARLDFPGQRDVHVRVERLHLRGSA